jgi:hypothetical protein
MEESFVPIIMQDPSYYLLGFYLLELLLLLIIHSPAGRPYIYLAIAILLA